VEQLTRQGEHLVTRTTTTTTTFVGFLGGLRVLDFADSSGRYALRLLADLGADVLRVTAPMAESLGPPPYVKRPGSDVSLFDRFVAVNSREIALDITTASGRQVFERLLGESALLVDTPDEHGVTAHGLSDDEVKELSPHLNRLSLRSFGSGGPKSGIAADDLTVLASSGLLSLGGYADAGPVEVAGLQSYFGRSIYGVVGALMVLLQGRKDGLGRHVEVSAQEVMAGALEDTVAEYDFNGHVRPRMGGVPRGAGTGTFKCTDGYIAMVAGRLGTAKSWVSLVEWLNEVGAEGAAELAEPAWADYQYRSSEGPTKRFKEIFEAFASTQSKEALYEEGQRRKIPFAPVNSARDVLKSSQLRERAFFHEVFDPELHETVTIPGRPYRETALSDLPYALEAVTPQGTLDTLASWGVSEGELEALRSEGAIK
jgi:crotonobetainyl-CoA:carnitine CoA-transferase CaiB-like acyl-CoA transferase